MKEVKLEEMKREYENIPVPEELEFRVPRFDRAGKVGTKKGECHYDDCKKNCD